MTRNLQFVDIDGARECERPALGYLAHAAIGFWATAIVAEKIAWLAYTGDEGATNTAARVSAIAPVVLPVVCAVILAVALRTWHRQRPNANSARCGRGIRGVGSLTLLALAVVCASLCGAMYWTSWENDVQWLSGLSGLDELMIELVSDPAQRDYGKVSYGQVAHGNRIVQVRVLWPGADDEEMPSAGHVIRAHGTVRVPGNDDSGRWNHQQGYAGSIQVTTFEDTGYAGGLRGAVTSLRDASIQRVSALGGEAAELLAGILLGNRTLYAGTELEQDFKTTGLAHLMAVSGTHLAVVLALFGWLLGRLPLGRRVKSAALVLLLCAYVALTAFSPSAMRACAMCAAGLIAFLFSRRRHVLSSLALCVIAFLALQPCLVFSMSYQLSCLCMVGLILLSPLVSLWIRLLFPARLGQLGDAAGATLAANLVTMPVTVPLFAQLPLISPLATFLASPLITICLGVGIPALLVYGAVPVAGRMMLGFAGSVSGACAQLVHALANVPVACVPLDANADWLGVLCAVIAISLWVLWPTPSRVRSLALGGRRGPVLGVAESARQFHSMQRAIRVCALAGLGIPLLVTLLGGLGGARGVVGLTGTVQSDLARVVMLDVGQGDAMLIQDGKAGVLIDTGEDDAVLLKALARNGVSSLDAVLLSHKDSDHTGALSGLSGVVRVGEVIVHQGIVGSDIAPDVLTAARWATGGKDAAGVQVDDTVRVGRFTLKLLAPSEAGESGNEDSLIWELSYDEDGDGKPESRGLLTGDGEEEAIEPVYRQLGDIEFCKVAHHGSKGAISEEQMSVLKPEISLISVGADNDYGHPTRDTIGVLERGGSKVLRTDLNGDITLSFQGSCIFASTQKDGG